MTCGVPSGSGELIADNNQSNLMQQASKPRSRTLSFSIVKTDDAVSGEPGQAYTVRSKILGYIREHFLMTEVELANARQNLVDYAEAHGYELGAIFVERLETAPAAFEAMAYELTGLDTPAIVVPGVHHLAVLGNPLQVRQQLEDPGGIRVLVARHAS